MWRWLFDEASVFAVGAFDGGGASWGLFARFVSGLAALFSGFTLEVGWEEVIGIVGVAGFDEIDLEGD